MIDFYYLSISPPCRPVLMVAEALNIDLNLKVIDTLIKKEQFKPEFVKINPQHCIPTIVDGELVLWESRAILTYLVNKYGKGSTLYPEDPQQRALVDQRLYFDIGTLYQRFLNYVIPIYIDNQPADETKLQKIEEALQFLNTFLEGNQWVAGPNLTLADFSIIATIANIRILLDVDIMKYPNVKAWFLKGKRVIPGFSQTEEAAESLKNILQDMKAKQNK